MIELEDIIDGDFDEYDEPNTTYDPYQDVARRLRPIHIDSDPSANIDLDRLRAAIEELKLRGLI